MFQKPLEYWFVLVGMALWVATRDAEREPLLKRASKTAISAALAVGISPSLAVYLNGSEVWATIAVMAFGLLVLDTASALLADRDFIKDLIRRKLGGGKDE
jgi:hypothetical protein